MPYYFDHASTTPLDPEVFESMLPFLKEHHGNPSNLHSSAQKTSSAIQKSKRTIAAYFDCSPENVIFTGSGSESNNLALQGLAFNALKSDAGKHLITSKIEHHAVLNVVKFLAENFNFDVTYLDVDSEGAVDIEQLEKSIRDETVFVSIMSANNEVGTKQNLEKIYSLTSERKVPFHTDAAQSIFTTNLKELHSNCDFLSFPLHKIYGPKGIGILIKKSDQFPIQSIIQGGSQENYHRAGTENTPYIVGAAKAIELCEEKKAENIKHLAELSDVLLKCINPDESFIFTGSQNNRIPGHVSCIVEGLESEELLMHLDMHGIEASSGSACNSGMPEASHVLLAMGFDENTSKGALRFSLGKNNSAKEVQHLIKTLPEIIRNLKES